MVESQKPLPPPPPGSLGLFAAVRKQHTHHVSITDAKPRPIAAAAAASSSSQRLMSDESWSLTTTATTAGSKKNNHNNNHAAKDDNDHIDFDATDAVVGRYSCSCNVCHLNEARYTCPRCHVPYCSVPCFRNHSNSSSSRSSKNSDGDGNVALCTEGFYQNRVSQVVELERTAKQDDTTRMLQRVHEQQQQQQQDDDTLMIPHHHVSSSSSLEDMNLKLSQQELLRMLQVLESGDESEIERLILSAANKNNVIQTAVLDAAQRGELQDWILEPWTPWWRPDLLLLQQQQQGSNDNDDSGDVDDDDDVEAVEPSNSSTCFQLAIKTLDERLLRAPKLSKLHRHQQQGKEVPDLTFNLVEILYSIVTTLRLYHGLVNAMECDSGVVVDAADTLICGSSVLARDARLNSLHEALVEATRKKSNFSNTNSYNDHSGGDSRNWTVLAQDVAIVCSHRRFVGRALLEAIDLVKGSIAVAKQAEQKQRNSIDIGSLSSSSSSLRKIKKKLEFYLSWSLAQQQQHQPNALSSSDDLRQQIETWISSWQLVQEEDDDKVPNNSADELIDFAITQLSMNQKTKSIDKEATGTQRALKSTGTTRASHIEDPLLLREVAVKRR